MNIWIKIQLKYEHKDDGKYEQQEYGKEASLENSFTSTALTGKLVDGIAELQINIKLSNTLVEFLNLFRVFTNNRWKSI